MNKENYWKLILVLFLVAICIFSVWPPESKLKPGIDLAGGATVVYQINTGNMPDYQKRTVAQDMIRILQQRIDPANQMNLVWRPHGNDRIEIQMPLATQRTREMREKFQNLLEEVLDQNLSIRKIQQAMAKLPDETMEAYRVRRDARFTDLFGESEKHQQILNELAAVQDELLEAGAARDETLQELVEVEEKLAEAEIRETVYRNLYDQWETLDDPNRTIRLERIAPEKPDVQQTLRDYIQTRSELRVVRNQINDPDTGLLFKREEIINEIERTNINENRLQKILGSRVNRDEQIVELKNEYPSVASKIDELVMAYDEYIKNAGRLDDPEDLIEKLRGSGVLEFRILPQPGDPTPTQGEISRYTERLVELGPRKASDDQYVWLKIMEPDAFERTDCYRIDVGGEEYVLCSNQPGETMLHASGEDTWQLQNARLTTDNIGKWAIGFGFNAIGAGKFWELTKENIGNPLAVVLDDQVISAPNIQSAISNSGQITGQFTQREAQDLVDKLNAGSLPARLGDQPLSVNLIGPTQGKENLRAGMQAAIWGLMAVVAFMLAYYLIAGVLADVALMMNLLLIIGVMAFMQATFTMPGIAGLILTIGMAVDANVLIFERLREEQARGSTLRMAIKNGYDRAFRTILDANLTTFAVALILYWLASEEIKGFALILMIGIVSSMFTALFVTRMVFDLLLDQKILKDRLKMNQFFGQLSVDWMGKRMVFWLFSVILVIVGWGLVFSRGEKILSIEFIGGTSIHAVLTEDGAEELLQDNSIAGTSLREKVENVVHNVGEKMNNSLIAQARVQRIGKMEDRTFEIVTTETNVVEATIVLGENTGRDAAEIQKLIREAAYDLGDNRMEEAAVQPLDDPGRFLVTTHQTNINKVQEAIAKALPVTVTIEPGDAARLKTAAEFEKALHRVARNQGLSLLERATVKEGEGGAFELTTQYTNQATIERLINDEELLPSAAVTFKTRLDILTTTNPIVTNAVLEALAGKLDVLTDLKPALREAQPINDELIAGKPYLAEFRGGVLLSIDFGDGINESAERIVYRRQESQNKSEFLENYGNNDFKLYGQYNGTVRPLVAEENDGIPADTELDSVEVAVVSPNITYGESGQDEWNQFVENEKARFLSIFEWHTSLPRITQIDPSIGLKSMNKAGIAIVVSLLAIVAYIWIRFGNWNFGVAAVAALFHDVSIALGLVALTGYIGRSGIPLISEFHIDLPLIAAFLTVIGYSLNDTIVVFDRIRENRGKMATLSLDVLNTSINQTFSRTILTSVTTLLVLVIMFIWGGEGLRSFNYVLIIGVLVGTYSSIGIASPLLTVLQSKEDQKKK